MEMDMEADVDVDMENEKVISPLPNEVLEVILSHLGLLDVLNCRLVRKEWNRECLTLLKASKYRLTLNQKSLAKYLQSNPTRQILPFHLKCKLKEEPDEDGNSDEEEDMDKDDDDDDTKNGDAKANEEKEANANGEGTKTGKAAAATKKKKANESEDDDEDDSEGEGESEGDDHEDSNDEDDNDNDSDDEPRALAPPNKIFAEFRANIGKLIDLFGPQCIRDLTFTHSDRYEEGYSQKLSDLLSVISPGLEKLNLRVDCEFPAGENQQMVLPNVKELYFGPTDRCHSDNGNKALGKLIAACPNLEKLKLGNIPTKQIKVGEWTEPFPPTEIKSLALAEFPVPWFMEKLRNHPNLPKSLQTLELKNCQILGNRTNSDAYRDILNTFSNSLISLKIPISFGGRNYGDLEENENADDPNAQALIQVPFRLLPKLKNLQITKIDLQRGRRERQNNSIEIDTEPFPSLESIDLPYDATLNTNDLTLTFPRVKSLTLRVRDDRVGQGDTSPRPYKENMENLLRVFPNVDKLAIVCQECSGGAGVKYVLKGILQNAEAAKVKHLELIGCAQNYLGDVLEHIQSPPRLILENIPRTPMMDAKIRDTFWKFTGGVDLEILDNANPKVGIRETLVQEINPCVQNFLTGLQKIRLDLSVESQSEIVDRYSDDRSRRFGVSDRLKQKLVGTKLHFDQMTKNFPLLKEVEVSSSMFSADGVSRAGRLQRIQEKFPNLIINII